MTEDTAHCLFCNQTIYLTKGRLDPSEEHPDGQPGQFIQAWITKIEIEDFFGVKSCHEGKGCMFVCQHCLENMNRSMEMNRKLASQ